MASGGGGDDDQTKSTTSVLGDIIKEYGLDKDNNLDLAAGVGDPNDPGLQQQQQQQEDNIVVGVEDAEGAAGGGGAGGEQQYVTVVPQIADADEQFVFDLIQDPNSPPLQEGLNEGEKIMASLTGFGALPPPNPNAAATGTVQIDPATGMPRAHVVILEDPAENKLRFRYECEGRSAGALHGQSSGADNKTYPTIQIVGYQGPAVCVVSLVEDKEPHRAHPHNLVGKDGSCKHGVCSVEINKPDMTYAFQNLGIQCVRKKDAPASLDQRQKIKVDPYKQGFSHRGGPIDLNCVRLCYQVFLKTRPGLVPLAPVVSKVIKDRKAHSDLQILEYSDDRCSVDGGKKILIFCDKVNKDDIEVHFTQYAKSGEEIVVKGDFTANDVHKQYGICLRTPAYVDKSVTRAVHCSMYLYKPKSKAASDPVDFWYMPCSHIANGGGAHAREARGATAAGGGSGSSSSSSHAPHNDLDHTPVIKPVKRGRPQNKANQDDSSGQIAVPSKQAPINWGGGQVVQQQQQQQQQQDYYGSPQQNNLNVDSPPQQFSPPTQQQQRSPYEQVTLGEGGAALTMRPVVQQGAVAQLPPPPPGPQGPQATPVQVSAADGEKVSDMTQHLQDLLKDGGQQRQQQAAVPAAAAGGPQPTTTAAAPGMHNLNAYLTSQEGAAYVAKLENAGSVADPLPPIDINSTDLVGDMENLSANLDSSLKIGKQNSGNNTAAAAAGQLQPGYLRQTSQLHTPDVSMSVEDASKRNNLNR